MGDRSEYQALLDMRDGVNCPRGLGLDTIVSGVVHTPYDLRLDALWRHDGAIASLSRAVRAKFISDASDAVMRGDI